jgi:hypothetical protein
MTQTITELLPQNTLRMATGRILDTGTVSEAFPMTIEVGFQPRYVKIFNLTGGSTGLITMEHVEGMDDDSGVKTCDEGTSETGVTLISSLGITLTANGFIIGLDTDLVVTSEQLTWIAIG